MPIRATRLSKTPIIRPHMDGRMGSNINGPAIIKMPDWAKDRLAPYHLYFSDHKGTYIRLAHAETLTGPWMLHTPGVLDVKASLFEPVNPPEPPEAERPPWARTLKGGYLYAHIASPDIHVDHDARCFRMYYHGLLRNGDQQTRLAISTDGLNFSPKAPLLGPPYFRAFRFGGKIYAITWGGEIWRAPDWEGPFERGPKVIPFDSENGVSVGMRHGEVHRAGPTLHLFYTRIGDCPERILHAKLDLGGDWHTWRASSPETLLEPELDWEGTDLALERSIIGGLEKRARQLRDPCAFKDTDNRTYLLYCGAGESGIGIAELHGI